MPLVQQNVAASAIVVRLFVTTLIGPSLKAALITKATQLAKVNVVTRYSGFPH